MIEILLKSRIFYIFIAIIMIISLTTAWNYRAIPANSFDENYILFLIHWEILSPEITLIIIIPFFLYLIGLVARTFNKCNVLLRYGNLKQWWHNKNISALIFSSIFALIINIVVLIAILFAGKIKLIGIDMIKFLLTGFFLQIAGSLILSGIFNIIDLLIDRAFMSFLITYFIILPFSLAGYIFDSPKASMFAINNYMFLRYKEDIIINVSDIFIIFWLVLIYLIMYFIGYFITKDKDIYWKA